MEHDFNLAETKTVETILKQENQEPMQFAINASYLEGKSKKLDVFGVFGKCRLYLFNPGQAKLVQKLHFLEIGEISSPTATTIALLPKSKKFTIHLENLKTEEIDKFLKKIYEMMIKIFRKKFLLQNWRCLLD